MKMINRPSAIALAAILLVATAGAVMAQAASTTADVNVNVIHVDTLWGWARTYVLDGINIIVAGAIGWAALWVKSKFGIDIEATHRDALHSAIMTGINLGFSPLDAKLSNWTVQTKSQAIADAVNWVLKSVPDAVKYFGLDEPSIRAMAEAKMNAILAGNAASVAPPVSG